uniref:Uncharacterized protein n=1 Tax=Tetraselmis sp. GSL018 TaxID=582737 RepID=A0A061RPH5_9CHLO
MSNLEKEVASFYATTEVCLRCVAKEPLRGLHVIQSHVQNSAPCLVRERVRLDSLLEDVTVCNYDVQSCYDTLSTMNRIGPEKLESIRTQLRRATSAARKLRQKE